MIDNEDIDLTDPLQRFCISTVTLKVVAIGMDRCVRAWNNHHISGHFPMYHYFFYFELKETNVTSVLPVHLIPVSYSPDSTGFVEFTCFQLKSLASTSIFSILY